MSPEFDELNIAEFIDVTDYVANGSFASLKENVEYKDTPDYAILVRLADHNRGWSGDYVYVTERAYKFLRKSCVMPGDVMISNVGANAGTVFRAPDLGMPMTLGPNSVLLKPKTKQPHITDYIYYYFVSPKGQQILQSILSGSAQPKFNKTDLRRSKIDVPKDRDYANCVKLLVCLDEKIQLNRQINQTLEQIAQAIFKSWFVDFEPVKAKIEAKQNGQDPERAAMCAISGKPEADLDQLPPAQLAHLQATAALFPDELIDSEQGLIPEGWTCLSLFQIVQLIGGGTPKRSSPEYWNGEIPWFSVHDAPSEGDVFVVDTQEKITQLGLDKSSTKLLPTGATIISARGTVGRLALTGVEMAMNQSCYGVIGVNGIGQYFNFFNLKKAVCILQQNTHGAVFDTITRQTFETVPCIKPTTPILNLFEMTVSPLMANIRNNLHEKSTLTQLRDTLLPKLLSGGLSVMSEREEAVLSYQQGIPA